jgi:hypothetical protein
MYIQQQSSRLKDYDIVDLGQQVDVFCESLKQRIRVSGLRIRIIKCQPLR